MTASETVPQFEVVTCGPDCDCDSPKTGIAVVTELDYFGEAYEDATTILLRGGEWVVYGPKREVLATYPVEKVVGFRSVANEVAQYVHCAGAVEVPDDKAYAAAEDGAE